MATFSLSNILADVAVRTRSPAFSATTRITDTQVTYWVTQSVRSLGALLMQHFPDDGEFVSVLEYNVQAGARTATLESTYEQVIAVIWKRGTNDYVLLGSSELEDLAVRTSQGWDTITPSYRLRGTQLIEFSPAPTKIESIDVYYTARQDESWTGSGNFLARIDHDLWITLDVAARVQEAKGRLAEQAGLVAQRRELEQNMLAGARKRDLNRSKTIRDVRGARARGYWSRWHGG